MFLETAESLLSDDHEADWRSAVSRAYYSSFLVARELVEIITRQQLANFDTHKRVRESLKSSGTPQGITLSKKLRTLHDQRKTSDYDLGAVVDYDDAEYALGQAEAIISLLETIQQTPAIYEAMQSKMIRHAQDAQEEV